MLNVLVSNVFEGDVLNNVKVDVEVVVNAFQDVHVKLEVEDIDVVDDLNEVEVVTVDGKVPSTTCEVHVTEDVKI